MSKIKTILVSQPKPNSEKSPYNRLKEEHNLKIDFRPFIHVEGLKSRDVRRQKIDFNVFNSIIFTSRNSVDHFLGCRKKCVLKFQTPQNIFVNQKPLLITYKNMLFTEKERFMLVRRTLWILSRCSTNLRETSSYCLVRHFKPRYN